MTKGGGSCFGISEGVNQRKSQKSGRRREIRHGAPDAAKKIIWCRASFRVVIRRSHVFVWDNVHSLAFNRRKAALRAWEMCLIGMGVL